MNDCHQVFVENFLLLVGHREEALIGLVQLFGRKRETKLFESIAQAGAARARGQHHAALAQPDVLRQHDLVRLPVLQETVDMDT